MMTKKHYVAIAKTLAALRAAYGAKANAASYGAAMSDAATELAVYFESENPRFDRARFLKACGVLEG